jgi:hypothetical protein
VLLRRREESDILSASGERVIIIIYRLSKQTALAMRRKIIYARNKKSTDF